MKIVFVMRHSGYVRNFESTLRLLCERGHRVHLAFQADVGQWLLDANDIAKQLAAEYPNFSRSRVPVRDDGWGLLGRQLRVDMDYLRYLNPEYRNAPKLRKRVERDASRRIVRAAQWGPLATRTGRKALVRLLRLMDRSIPRGPDIDDFLREHRPDLLVVTPLVEPGSPQADHVRSARAQGIPTVLCVASWDNLTNKGLIHDPVDLVAVWNEPMKREAVLLHGVPAERVVVTGAQPFDHWFGWCPSTTREAFCRRVALPADRPYFLYACSSKFVAPEEAPFVRKWAAQLRESSSSALREAGVLVRPHPQNADQWRNTDFEGLGPVTVWPPAGAAPVDTQSRSEYFDSIYHSAAVVGVNTTAEIESAIVGRGVYTVLAPEFRETQEGTLHFHHLRDVNGGLVQVAGDFAAHLAHLETALQNPQIATGRCRRFVEAFVRPFGIDVPATPKLVAALEKLAATPIGPAHREPLWAPIARTLLTARAARVGREAIRALAAKAAKEAAKKDKEQRKNKRGEDKNVHKAEKVDGVPGSSLPPDRNGAEVLDPRQRLERMVATYRGLPNADRVRFVRAVADVIPPELWLEQWMRIQLAKPERLDYPHAEIFMRVTSKAERSRLRGCAKEPFTIDWIHDHVEPESVLYDIGANVGAYSLVAAKRRGGGARVVAFEPSYANVAALCANVALNHLDREITPMPVALSNVNMLTTLNLRALEPGTAKHVLANVAAQDTRTVFRQPVITYRLDDLIEDLRLPPPNHIKLDVDGGELEVLEGAARTIASAELRSMLIEVSTPLSENVTVLLQARGLQLQSRINVRNKAGEYLIWYGLFTRDPVGATTRPLLGAR